MDNPRSSGQSDNKDRGSVKEPMGKPERTSHESTQNNGTGRGIGVAPTEITYSCEQNG